jgi:hypothetical protein
MNVKSKLTLVERVDFEGRWGRLPGELPSAFTAAEIQDITGASPEWLRAAVANGARQSSRQGSGAMDVTVAGLWHSSWLRT